MTDKSIATIGRSLAKALNRFARERNDADRKNVAIIQTELCQAVHAEEIEAAQQQAAQQPTDTGEQPPEQPT